MATYDELPRDAHHVLVLMQELQAQLGLTTPDAIAEKLRQVKGSSKTAKLAKSTLQVRTRAADLGVRRARFHDARIATRQGGTLGTENGISPTRSVMVGRLGKARLTCRVESRRGIGHGLREPGSHFNV